MFIIKNKYYIYIDNISSINLGKIRQKYKINLIYRNFNKNLSLKKLLLFIRECKRNNIKFFVANDLTLALKADADGIYLSSFNRKFIKKRVYGLKKFKIIGSAHNFSQINFKMKQGCKEIILSRLFKTDYEDKKSSLGVTKFNLIASKFRRNFIALGGIKIKNLMKIQMLNCEGIAILSEAKKKPAIIRRLF